MRVYPAEKNVPHNMFYYTIDYINYTGDPLKKECGCYQILVSFEPISGYLLTLC